MKVLDMDPVTITVIGICAGIAAGFGILTEATKPIVIDAEIKATLAEIPVQCRKQMGGDPMSVQCQWASCLQYGQSTAQRPECSAVRDLLVDTLKGTAAE